METRHVRVEGEVGGVRLVLETGQVARQAGGSVIATLGDTMVFAACTAGAEDAARRPRPRAADAALHRTGRALPVAARAAPARRARELTAPEQGPELAQLTMTSTARLKAIAPLGDAASRLAACAWNVYPASAGFDGIASGTFPTPDVCANVTPPTGAM